MNVSMSVLAKLILAVVVVALNSACVTTTTSRYDDKKDLVKAEQTYIKIGYGYFEQGNLLASKRSLIQALEINKRSSGAHLGLARVYEQELEFDLANDHFKKAIRYGASSEIYFQYGAYLYNRGEYRRAYRQFDKVLEDTLYGRRANTFEFQGVVAARLGRTKQALGFYQRAIALNPALPNSYLGLANLYVEEQQAALAYQHYSGFVELVRNQLARQTPATLWLGIQLAAVADDADALASLTLQLRNRFPTSAEYQRYLDWQSAQEAG